MPSSFNPKGMSVLTGVRSSASIQNPFMKDLAEKLKYTPPQVTSSGSATPPLEVAISAQKNEPVKKEVARPIQGYLRAPSKIPDNPAFDVEDDWRSGRYNRFVDYGEAIHDEFDYKRRLALSPSYFQTQLQKVVRIRLIKDQNRVESSDGARVKNSVLSPRTLWHSGYTHFFLQGVSRARQERVQVLETFTSNWVFLFGERTPMYNFSGMLLNYGKSATWANDWLKMYSEEIRATKAIENKAICEIEFDDVICRGYIINTSMNLAAEFPWGVPFSFLFIVTEESYKGFGLYFNTNKAQNATDDAIQPNEVTKANIAPKASVPKHVVESQNGKANFVSSKRIGKK